MANKQNLIPQAHKLSVEEQSRGGKASVVARRKYKEMKQQAELLMRLDFVSSQQLTDIMKKMGFKDSEMNNQLAMIVQLYRTAIGGGKNSVQAFRELREVLEYNNNQEINENAPTPMIEINVVDNSDLESIMYEEK